MWVVRLLTDGGTSGTETRHHECRNCGRNLSPDPESCPNCDGSVAEYVL